MLHTWHAVNNSDNVCDGPPSGSFATHHETGYFFDVVGHCQLMEVFHKSFRCVDIVVVVPHFSFVCDVCIAY